MHQLLVVILVLYDITRLPVVLLIVDWFDLFFFYWVERLNIIHSDLLLAELAGLAFRIPCIIAVDIDVGCIDCHSTFVSRVISKGHAPRLLFLIDEE